MKRRLHCRGHRVLPAHGEDAGISGYVHRLFRVATVGTCGAEGINFFLKPLSQASSPLLTYGPLPRQYPPLEHFLATDWQAPHHPSGLSSDLNYLGHFLGPSLDWFSTPPLCSYSTPSAQALPRLCGQAVSLCVCPTGSKLQEGRDCLVHSTSQSKPFTWG